MSEEYIVNPATGEMQLNPAQIGALARRIAAASGEIESVAKRGFNTHFKYAFATAEDVKRAVQPALAKQGIAIIPMIRNVTTEGKKTRVFFDFTVACEEGYISVPWVAEAGSVDDKAIAKCVTTALKYFSISLLQISTGDEEDVDTDAGARGSQKRQSAQRRKPQSKVRGGNGKDASASDEPQDRSLEWACDVKTGKGTRFGELNYDQLQVIVDNSKSADRVQAANMLLDEISVKLASIESEGEAPTDLAQLTFEEMIAGK